MDIHEYQAKEVLARYGVNIAPGRLAHSPEEAVSCYHEIGTPVCVVKAQVHSGARGKAGGIRVCSSKEEISKATSELIGQQLVTHQTGAQGKLIEKVYIEEGTDIGRELYLALVLDRASERVTIVTSSQGGMSIEEVAADNPDSIHKTSIDPAAGLCDFQAREVAFRLNIPKNLIKDTVKTLKACYNALIDCDASLIEINPLVVTQDEKELLALDAKVQFDDNGLFRHPQIAEMRDKSQEDPRETKASDSGLSYVGLDGNIGCMINGAGLAMATMDMIKFAGGSPANFLDIGGGASPERVAKAFELVLQDKNVKAMLVNIYAGINRCDWIAEGVIKAVQSLKLTVPLVVRLAGTNVEEGRRMLKESDLDITTATTLGEAAEAAVALSKQS